MTEFLLWKELELMAEEMLRWKQVSEKVRQFNATRQTRIPILQSSVRCCRGQDVKEATRDRSGSGDQND